MMVKIEKNQKTKIMKDMRKLNDSMHLCKDIQEKKYFRV